MLIKGLMVEGVGRFTTPTRIEGLREGVNVLAAGNEAGKSTLFRALRACLFTRHDSRAEEVRSLCADDSQLPAIVEVAFEHEGRHYTIRKSFMKSIAAELHEDGREIARSKRADEALWELLGLNPGSGRSLDEGAFGVLWVDQRKSFDLPVPRQAASSALNSAIESEVGTLVGGERARQLSEQIKAELRPSLTDNTDKPRANGPLDLARKDVETWKAEEQATLEKLRALDQQFVRLRALQDRQKELNDPAMAAQLREDLQAARAALSAGRTAVEELRRFESDETSAGRAFEMVSERLVQFRGLVGRIDSNRQREGELAASLEAHEAKEREATAALGRTNAQIAQVEQDANDLLLKENRLAKLEAAVVRAERRGERARQLDVVRDAARKLSEVDAHLAQLPVRTRTISELEAVEFELHKLDVAQSSAATQARVEVMPAGIGKVEIAGLAQLGAQGGPILAPTTITVGDLAIITLTPPPDRDLAQREGLQDKRRALLAGIGADGMTAARAMLVRRQDLENDRKGIAAQLKGLGAAADPATVIATIEAELVEIDAATKSVLSEAERSHLPDRKLLADEQLELGQQRAPLDARRRYLSETRGQQAKAADAAKDARLETDAELMQLRKTIAMDVALCPDPDRAPRETALLVEMARSENEYRAAASFLAAKRETVPDASEIERRETRCRRLEEALENRGRELMKLEGELGRLTGQIQTAGGEGIGEALAVVADQRALAERALARQQERIETLKLLRDTIGDCLAESRERLHAPVRRHLRPFIGDLFPGAELQLDEGFQVSGIRRNRAETFDRLSDGTQEQIAVIVRLAMASMLAEQGQVVPVVLDDALVYCDDDRIKRMFDALGRAGRQQQVIVLTCRLRAFSALGGNMLSIDTA